MLNEQSLENIVEDFNSGASESEEEENNNNLNEKNEIIINSYNPAIYNFEFTYSFFKTNEILYTNYRCPYCNNIMNLVSENTFLDKFCFRCCKRSPKHDVKYSIRKTTFLENIRINMITLYFLIFECFINKMSANKAYNEFKNF